MDLSFKVSDAVSRCGNFVLRLAPACNDGILLRERWKRNAFFFKEVELNFLAALSADFIPPQMGLEESRLNNPVQIFWQES